MQHCNINNKKIWYIPFRGKKINKTSVSYDSCFTYFSAYFISNKIPKTRLHLSFLRFPTLCFFSKNNCWTHPRCYLCLQTDKRNNPYDGENFFTKIPRIFFGIQLSRETAGRFFLRHSFIKENKYVFRWLQ